MKSQNAIIYPLFYDYIPNIIACKGVACYKAGANASCACPCFGIVKCIFNFTGVTSVKLKQRLIRICELLYRFYNTALSSNLNERLSQSISAITP
jgi:hypothetical protein